MVVQGVGSNLAAKKAGKDDLLGVKSMRVRPSIEQGAQGALDCVGLCLLNVFTPPLRQNLRKLNRQKNRKPIRKNFRQSLQGKSRSYEFNVCDSLQLRLTHAMRADCAIESGLTSC